MFSENLTMIIQSLIFIGAISSYCWYSNKKTNQHIARSKQRIKNFDHSLEFIKIIRISNYLTDDQALSLHKDLHNAKNDEDFYEIGKAALSILALKHITYPIKTTQKKSSVTHQDKMKRVNELFDEADANELKKLKHSCLISTIQRKHLSLVSNE